MLLSDTLSADKKMATRPVRRIAKADLITERQISCKRLCELALLPQDGKKLPWDESALRASSAGKRLVPQRVGHHVKRPQVLSPVMRDASGVITPAPPMLEPSLGITGPRNVPPAKVTPDDADNRSRLSLATIPKRATGRSRINEAKGSGDPSLPCGSTSTGDGL